MKRTHTHTPLIINNPISMTPTVKHHAVALTPWQPTILGKAPAPVGRFLSVSCGFCARRSRYAGKRDADHHHEDAD